MRVVPVPLLALALLAAPAAADPPDPAVLVDARRDTADELARRLWGWAELGYQEEKSSQLLQAELARAGFRVTAGVAGLPTAFVAEWGEGAPVIGILAELDALPGLSQAAVPRREPVTELDARLGAEHDLPLPEVASALVAFVAVVLGGLARLPVEAEGAVALERFARDGQRV